jgi:hypothetical protein
MEEFYGPPPVKVPTYFLSEILVSAYERMELAAWIK